MNLVFMRECNQLKESILRQADDVQARFGRALKATADRDTGTLRQLIASDTEVDTREVEIEEECLKILALHQPVACDLRFVIAVLKINNDLERIGDIAMNLADRGIRLCAYEPHPLRAKIAEMGFSTRTMLRQSVDALLSLDRAKALEVIQQDDAVDDLNREVIAAVVAEIPKTASPEALILTHSMARDIERIGDHATNIAEDVVYLIDGSIIRHQKT